MDNFPFHFYKTFHAYKISRTIHWWITVKRETVTKFLDVSIDENDTWKADINTKSTKISKRKGIVYRARLTIPRKKLNQLCFSFVHSYLNYANLACCSTQKTKCSTLFRQYKQSIRLIRFKDQFTHSKRLFKEIAALNMYETNIFNILCLKFKCKNEACPQAFESLLTLKPKNKYQLKRICTLLQPFCKCEFRQICISNLGPHLWNTIVLSQNTDLEKCATLNFFNEKIKAYLFTLDNVIFLFWYYAIQEDKYVS